MVDSVNIVVFVFCYELVFFNFWFGYVVGERVKWFYYGVDFGVYELFWVYIVYVVGIDFFVEIGENF